MRNKLWLARLTEFLWTSIALAATTGSIRGTVSDPSGAVLSGAQVLVLNQGTNEQREQNADASGSFEFILLPVGTYTLKVEQPGSAFKSYVVRDIALSVNQVATFRVSLQLGAAIASVDVEANPIQVDLTATQIGTVIDSKPILDLPLNGRNVYQLVALQPGIVVASNGNGNPAASFQNNSPLPFSSGGGRLGMNNFMVDGADTNNALSNQAAVQIIPDAVQEFRVITNTFNAEFGRNSGSVVNIITRSGSNNWHGSLFEFFRNDKLNARNYFEIEKAPYKLNQFGGTVGGPARHNKTFVFGSFQATHERIGEPGSPQTVFTPEQRNGNFSGDVGVGSAGFPGVLANRLCFPGDSSNASNCFAAGTPYNTIFPGAIIPTSLFNPVAANILTKYIPVPNSGGDFISSPVQPFDSYQFTVKLDHQLNQNHRLGAFYYFNDYTLSQAAPRDGRLPEFPVATAIRTQNVSLTDTWLIKPTTLNEFRLGYLRISSGKETSPVSSAPPSSFGFAGIAPGPPASEQSLPLISISGGPALGGAEGSQDFQNTYQISDYFSEVIKRHSLKFGGDYRQIRYVQRLPTDHNGAFAFNGGGPNSTGDPFADFVLGLPDTYVQGSISNQRLSSHEVDFYGQDSWQVRQNLTLNFGLRWELYTPFVEKNNELELVQFPTPGQSPQQSKTFPTAPPGYLYAGDHGIPRGLANTVYHNFAPRVGLAYNPEWVGGGKVVVRAAYGVFYNPVEQAVLLQLNGEPPFAAASALTAPGFATPFLAQSGQSFPDPFPFFPPPAGTPVNFSQFFPIIQFGQLLPSQKTQYVEQYNTYIEYQLSPTTVLAAGYVGSQGHHLLASYDANHGSPALCMQLAAQGCGPFGEDTTYVTPGGATVYGTRPAGTFANNGLAGSSGLEAFSDVITIDSVAQSSYNSGQLRLERRGKSLQFLASYTFSKTIDNASGFENLLNPTCFACDIGLSAFDARHHFIFSSTYELPFGNLTKNSFWKKVVGNWEVGGIYTYQSGVPVHLTDTGSDNSLQGSFDGFEPPDRPVLVKPLKTQNPRENGCAFQTGPGTGSPCSVIPNQFFNPNSFAFEPLGQIGSTPHNFFPGSPVNNLDFTAIKRVAFTERYRFEFRTEVFNLLNHAQFYNPDANISHGANFGRVLVARDPRFIQFAAKLMF
jgi:hypothetical protein